MWTILCSYLLFQDDRITGSISFARMASVSRVIAISLSDFKGRPGNSRDLFKKINLIENKGQDELDAKYATIFKREYKVGKITYSSKSHINSVKVFAMYDDSCAIVYSDGRARFIRVLGQTINVNINVLKEIQ